MVTRDFTEDTKKLIDNLKRICASFGLGNDGNEFKIILQVFLYKFMNDKFAYEIKELEPKLKDVKNWEDGIAKYTDKEYDMLLIKLGPDNAKLKREHYLSCLFKKNKDNEQKDTQNGLGKDSKEISKKEYAKGFANLFDDTLRDIAIFNAGIFSVQTETGEKIKLFDDYVSNYITDPSKRDDFCWAVVNQLIEFSFEKVFGPKCDFFSTIFEYLIKDYNKDGGGKYGEYYTPHSVAQIIASILVDGSVCNVTCYDPSAGSGTLLIALAHSIGESNCSIYSQDISQKSNTMLRLNLILNNLVHSLPHIIQGNTLTNPYHKEKNNKLDSEENQERKKTQSLMKFDYIVSNPPFKLDFSDYRELLDSKEHENRFFAGIPKVPKKDKDKMPIYLLFIQHIIYSLSDKGKAAIVVPTGFLTAQGKIEKAIRKELIDKKMLLGVVSMPSNIFATTGTNVSIIFLDKTNSQGNVILMDASKLGTTIKEGKNQKTQLSKDEENKIVAVFKDCKVVEDFTAVVSYDQIEKKNYSFSAGQYFEVKIEYTDITPEEFKAKMNDFKTNLNALFSESRKLEEEIIKQLEGLKYE